MNSKIIIKISLSLTILLMAAFLSLYGCYKQEDNKIIAGQNYNTPYGNVTVINDYPLYRIDYTSDYEFDEYLQTGVINLTNTFNAGDDGFQCTCFSASGKNTRLFGRNYDWSEKSSYYLVFTKPENAYSSVSTVDLSFFTYDHNQSPQFQGNLNTIKLLPYFPFDGLNEMGLSIGMNALDDAQSPNDPDKVTIGELQLIRLVLDYAATVNEAVNLIGNYNIRMENPPIHYLLADSTGQSAIVEFVDGEMEVFYNSNPWQVTTNFIISGINIPQDSPCWRYTTAYQRLNSSNGIINQSEAIELLQSVSVSATRWSVVYDLKNKQIKIAMGGRFNNTYQYSISH